MVSWPVAVVLPARNAARALSEVDAVASSPQVRLKLLIDSGSVDGTAQVAQQLGWVVERVHGRFDHGGTRGQALRRAAEVVGGSGIVVFLTQDVAAPRRAEKGPIEMLLGAFEEEGVGAAYGRQVPRPGAGAIESHARLFNYPERSEVRTYRDRERLGIKACFFSNSFAAYRVSALESVGGFPERAIVGEDVVVAAKLLKAGWKVAYVADAWVYHSHDLTPLQEMRRYFDIGVFHSRESWILRDFGGPEGEGVRFLRSQLGYLRAHAPWLIPGALLRAGLKYVGYRVGRAEGRIPLRLKRALSRQKQFWEVEEEILARRRARGSSLMEAEEESEKVQGG